MAPRSLLVAILATLTAASGAFACGSSPSPGEEEPATPDGSADAAQASEDGSAPESDGAARRDASPDAAVIEDPPEVLADPMIACGAPVAAACEGDPGVTWLTDAASNMVASDGFVYQAIRDVLGGQTSIVRTHRCTGAYTTVHTTRLVVGPLKAGTRGVCWAEGVLGGQRGASELYCMGSGAPERIVRGFTTADGAIALSCAHKTLAFADGESRAPFVAATFGASTVARLGGFVPSEGQIALAVRAPGHVLRFSMHLASGSARLEQGLHDHSAAGDSLVADMGTKSNSANGADMHLDNEAAYVLNGNAIYRVPFAGGPADLRVETGTSRFALDKDRIFFFGGVFSGGMPVGIRGVHQMSATTKEAPTTLRTYDSPGNSPLTADDRYLYWNEGAKLMRMEIP